MASCYGNSDLMLCMYLIIHISSLVNQQLGSLSVTSLNGSKE